VFYALERSRLAVAISAGSMGVNVVASVLLVQWLGFRGLALGTAVAALAHGALALFVLRRHLAGIDGARLASRFVRILVAALVMAAAVALAEQRLTAIAPGGGLVLQAGRLSGAIVVGLVMLALAAKLLRVPEFNEAVAAIRSRLFPSIDR
jgi:putative peptidoglycan lipid II flippase